MNEARGVWEKEQDFWRAVEPKKSVNAGTGVQTSYEETVGYFSGEPEIIKKFLTECGFNGLVRLEKIGIRRIGQDDVVALEVARDRLNDAKNLVDQLKGGFAR